MKTQKLISGLIMSTLLLAGCNFGSQAPVDTSTEDKTDVSVEADDPLTSYVAKPEESNLKGDFFGSGLSQYDGPISSSVQICIDDYSNADLNTNEIIAKYNPKYIFYRGG